MAQFQQTMTGATTVLASSLDSNNPHPQPQTINPVDSGSIVGREQSIASSFVKQYYTMLNRAPQFIHNFYSDHSTFIHGSVEIAGQNHTGPVFGRDRISKKMTEMNLIDCRAKIKQIDCLETLAGGFVIQVIGELSNNGKPMKRFLQTFVLAPSRDDLRSEPDLSNSKMHHRKNINDNISNSFSNSANEKFYVLNSIFRYQDDGQENEFEDDLSKVHANSSVDAASAAVYRDDYSDKKHSLSGILPPNGSAGPERALDKNAREISIKSSMSSEVTPLAEKFDEKINLRQQPSAKEVPSKTVVSNGAGDAGIKCEIQDKSSESAKSNIVPVIPAPNNLVSSVNNADSASTTSFPSATLTSVAASKESVSKVVPAKPTISSPHQPKTWANMVKSSQSTTQPNQQQTVQTKVVSTSEQATLQSPSLSINPQQSHQHKQHDPQNRRSRSNRKPPNRKEGTGSSGNSGGNGGNGGRLPNKTRTIRGPPISSNPTQQNTTPKPLT